MLREGSRGRSRWLEKEFEMVREGQGRVRDGVRDG